MLRTTAAGRPCLVMTTRPCSRSSRYTTSDRRFFTSARGMCSAAEVIAITLDTTLAASTVRSAASCRQIAAQPPVPSPGLRTHGVLS